MILDPYKRDDYELGKPLLHTSGDPLMGFIHFEWKFGWIKSVKGGFRVPYTPLPKFKEGTSSVGVHHVRTPRMQWT